MFLAYDFKLSILGSCLTYISLLLSIYYLLTHFEIPVFESICGQHNELNDSGQRKGRRLFVFFKVLYKNFKRAH